MRRTETRELYKASAEISRGIAGSKLSSAGPDRFVLHVQFFSERKDLCKRRNRLLARR